MKNYLRIFCLLCLVAASSMLCAKSTVSSVQSPDGHIRVEIRCDETEGIRWRTMYDSTVVTDWAQMGLNVVADGESMQPGAAVMQEVGVTTRAERKIPQPTYVKRSMVHDEYHVLFMDGNNGAYRLEWRVYNDGVAYRWMLQQKGPAEVVDETVEYRFAGDYEALLPYENDLRGRQTMCFSMECYYDRQHLSEMYADSLCITPLCVTLPNGIRVIPAETNIRNYPGMFLKKGEGNSLRAVFPRIPTGYVIGGYTDLNLLPVERENIIARQKTADGTWTMPWRVVGIFTSDKQILNSDLMQCLAQADIKEPGTNTPDFVSSTPRGKWCGQSTWDWWNDWGLAGVDFQPGINQPTYEYYARFAAENGIPYMIVDDGWSDHGDLFHTVGELDIPSLVDYAGKLGVKVILWSSYRALCDDTKATMKHYAKMGVAGFKVDFFDRNDQVVTDDVWRLANIALANDLLLDLHGYMPTGIQAVYPNVLSFEGIKGLENFKWEQQKDGCTEHDHPRNVVTAPFLRGFVGPYDYTPGSMRNATCAEFAGEGLHTIGTRANQLAMYVVMEAPLQMLADSPTEYERYTDALRFITSVPTIFDETVVLDAEIGEYIVLARRSGKKWYVGALTREARTLELPLSFLGKGKHRAQIVADGQDAETYAKDAAFSSRKVKAGQTLTLQLATAGGWAAIIE